MKNKIPLTIALTASMSFGVAIADQAKSTDTQSGATETTQSSPIAQGEGKCASGKCGSLKKFSSVDIKGDETGKLIRVRDGSCGTFACKPYDQEGKNQEAQLGKCSNGTCGQ